MQEFGSRAPAFWLSKAIHICHNPSAPLHSRYFAPVVRKLALANGSRLPLDISVDGINLRCQFTDNYSEKKYIFTTWRYDLAERRLLSQILSSGGNFIDIGANVGLYTLTAAKALQNQSGKILAIEPNPQTLARLNVNLAINTALIQGRVRVINCGVADREESFELHVDPSNLGASSISDKNRSRSLAKEMSSVRIQCRLLLDILQDEGIESFKALKIDIEGAEDKALEPYLKNCNRKELPQFIFFENSEHLWRFDLFTRIKEYGYERVIHNRMNSVFQKIP